MTPSQATQLKSEIGRLIDEFVDDPPPPPPPSPPLLQPDDLTYLGVIRVPTVPWNTDGRIGRTFSYGGRGIAVNPETQTAYVVGNNNFVAEITLPEPGSDKRAKFVQPFSNAILRHILGETIVVSDGRTLTWDDHPWTLPDSVSVEFPDRQIEKNPRIGGLLVHDGSLLWTCHEYYDNDGSSQQGSHGCCELDFSSPDGLFRVDGVNPGAVGGYLAHSRDGKVICGMNRLPSGHGGSGPIAVEVDPAVLGLREYFGHPLIYYPNQDGREWNQLTNGGAALDEKHAHACRGAAWIDDTLIVVGWRPVGQVYYSNNGPSGTCKGDSHGSDGREVVLWFFDATKLGTGAAPWEPLPYATVALKDDTLSQQCARTEAATYDPVRRLYVVQHEAERPAGTEDSLPVIHVYQLPE